METTGYGTRYAEAELILAAQAEDYATVTAHLRQMLPGEKQDLIDACRRLETQVRLSRGESPDLDLRDRAFIATGHVQGGDQRQ